MPQSSSAGIPLHLLRWPSSPSQIPAWATGSVPAPVYTFAVAPTPSATHEPTPSSAAPAVPGPYNGLDCTFDNTAPMGAPTGLLAPPQYNKLEFPTFDGGVDPLYWLN